MSSVINKRQQARHERTLQELIRSVPGNDQCADCQARNPGWASWSLGIFLCVRCAALHRKLGTHISKVKSLSMDTWTLEQVEAMKSVGNTASNRHLNPRNVKPTIPLDPDEVDGAMEKFIRQKYQHKKLVGDIPALAAVNNTGSTRSTDDRPPPPPPKPLARFGPGLRSSSATFPSALVGGPPNPAQPSRLGWTDELRQASAPNGGTSRGRRRSSFDGKLVHLRQLGFRDGEKNLTVLKEVDGDIQRAVDVLRRFGGGQQGDNGFATTQAPLSELNIQKARGGVSHFGSSSNPYQRHDRPTLSTVNSESFEQNQAIPQQTSYNPFEASSQANQNPLPFEASFQDPRLTQEPLFPNHTGTWPLDHQQQSQHNPFLKTFTPPISPSPYQYQHIQPFQAAAIDLSNQLSTPQSATSMNPFFRQAQPQAGQSMNPFEQAQAGQTQSSQTVQQLPQQYQPAAAYASSDWTQTDTSNTQAALLQAQPSVYSQPQPTVYSQLQPSAHLPMQSPSAYPQQVQSPFDQPFSQVLPVTSPYAQQPYQTPSYFPSPSQQPSQPSESPYSYNHVQHPQPNFFTPQQQTTTPQTSTPFRDKNSILALYSQPHLAPTRLLDNKYTQEPASAATAAGQDPPIAHVKRRSVTMPVSSMPTATTTASLNPFANLTNMSGGGGGGGGVDGNVGLTANANGNGSLANVGGENGNGRNGGGAQERWSGHGRWSPDAFAGLSARVGAGP